jgi:L-ribulose-5-phosphate 3-epimerase
MWSSYLIEKSPEEMVKIFVDHRWYCTELSSAHARTLLERGNPEKSGREFREFAEDLGFSFPQGHFYITADIAHPDDSEREKIIDELKKWCDLFAALDIKAGVLHPGGVTWYQKKLLSRKKQIFERNVESLKKIADFTKGGPTAVCLENLEAFSTTAGELLELIKSAGNDSLAVCLDTAHLNMTGGNFADFIRMTGKKLKALHVSDSVDKENPHILPYGAGTIDWKSFIQALREVKYEGLFNFEVPRENKCPMDIRLAKLDYVRKLTELIIQS